MRESKPGAVSTVPTSTVIATRRPLLTGVLLSLIPVAFVVAGQVLGQVGHLDDRGVYFTTAMMMAMSALVGLMVAARAQIGLANLGLRAPRNLGPVLWLIPPLAVVGISFLGSGFAVSSSMVLPLLCMALAAAFSEEIWFRGFVLAVLRVRGARYGVIGSSVMFAVLHLSNALSGQKNAEYLLLQVLFAALFGFVAAEIMVLTGSLWVVIAWHFAWDAVNYLGGDALSTRSLLALTASVLVLAGYAVWLWREIPAKEVA